MTKCSKYYNFQWSFIMHLSSFVNKKTAFYIVNIIITVKISQTRINEFLIGFKIANNQDNQAIQADACWKYYNGAIDFQLNFWCIFHSSWKKTVLYSYYYTQYSEFTDTNKWIFTGYKISNNHWQVNQAMHTKPFF